MCRRHSFSRVAGAIALALTHLSPRLKMYGGDSRGRWEGRTLVVTTTNFNGVASLQGNAGGRPSERLTVVERFTLVDSNTLLYEATFDDPQTMDTAVDGQVSSQA